MRWSDETRGSAACICAEILDASRHVRLEGVLPTLSGARVSAGGGGEDLIDAVKKMRKREREVFLEDLLAATSPEYLRSICEARADEQAGRVRTHAEVFGGQQVHDSRPRSRGF